jgi:hypothetical protein
MTARDQWLRLLPFLTGLRVSSTVTDLVLIYESIASSASVLRWLTLRSWTIELPSEFLRLNYWTSSYELSLSLMLRPTVSRPVCLGIKHLSGAYGQVFITVRQLRVCWCGVLSLTRGRVCRLVTLTNQLHVPLNSRRTEQRPPPRTVRVLFHVCSL